MLRRGPMYERGALSRQDDLKKVGINIKITLLDTAGFRDRTEKGDFQAYTVLSGGADSMSRTSIMGAWSAISPRTWGSIVTRSLIQLFQEQSQTFDVQKRAEITRQMERLLLQDVPDDRGFYWKSAMAYWNRVTAMAPYPGDDGLQFWQVRAGVVPGRQVYVMRHAYRH